MRSVLRRGLTPNAANTARRPAATALLNHTCASAAMVSMNRATFSNNGAAITQRRMCSSTAAGGINPDEISFVDDSAASNEHDGGASSSSSGAATSNAVSYTDVSTVDTFSRARVINFVKRYTPKNPTTMGSSAAAADEKLFEVTPFQHTDSHTGFEDTLYHARVRIPFPEEEYGVVYGEGIASFAKDAELLAAMHAEQIIDAYGYQIYTLASMQKKHAEAARAAGRWAPMPDEGLRDVSAVRRPNPLRRVIDRDESEGARFDLVDSRPLPFFQHKHTMLSPAILDPGVLVRIKNYFTHQNAPFEMAVSFKEFPPIDKADPAFYEAYIALTPLNNQINNASNKFVSVGKGTDKNIALILSAMHAEMIIDAYGGALYPMDSEMQTLHAKTARGYGRPVVIQSNGEQVPSCASVRAPKPLKLFVSLPSAAGRGRVCALGAEEDFVRKNLIVVEGITAFNNVETELDGSAQKYLEQFLMESGYFPRFKNPYVLEKVGSQWRATVVLPVPSSYGIRGGVGVAESELDAQRLAAMHAIDILVALGIPICKDPAQQQAFVEHRTKQGKSVPAADPSTVDKAMPSPAGLRKVTVTELPRPKAADVTPEASAASSSTPEGEKIADPCDPMPHRETTPKSYWNLDPDTTDGFILVRQHGDPNEPPAKLFGHTLSCIRRIDPMAKNRIVNYLAFLGKRPANTFTFQKLPAGRDGHAVHRCIIKLPVPAEVGERLAVGEGPELREAEILACMHAELILDNIGVPLYPDRKQQLKHATAATSVGRFAPFPEDPLQDKSTPSPPPLRMVREAAAAKGTAKPVSNGRVNPYLKEASEKQAAAKKAEEEAAAAAAATAKKTKTAAAAEPIVILEEQIDQNSRQRVNNYFRRNVKVLPEPTTIFECKGNQQLHTAKMWVPVTAKFGERYAIGMAEKKKDADALCYMHAERIIDALGLHLFNLPGLQKRHAERVKKEGRWAPLPGELLNKDANTPSPPPLKSGIAAVQQVKSSAPICDEMAQQDFTAWGVYVQECEEFIDIAIRRHENECYDRDQVPLTGDPFVDSALADVQEMNTDIHAKSLLTNYLTLTNQPYPSLWRSRAVGNINNRKCLTMVEVPGYRHLTALGVSSSKEISQRRAAMHMMALFKRLDPTFHATMASDITASLPRGADGGPIVDSRGKALSSRQLAQREAVVGSWDATANAFTNDGKVRIIELFTVCNALPAPFVYQKQKTEGGYTVSTTFVEVLDEDGRKHIGSAEDQGPRRNETGAFNDLFINMSKSVPSFQSLMQLVRTHPHLSPDQIVDLSIPSEIAERIERLVDSNDEDTIEESAMPSVCVDVTTEGLVSQQDITVSASPAVVARRSTELQRALAAKLESNDYKEKFKPRRESLSIWKKRDEIMDIISNNQVTVVCGTTGCGKTTQIPQYILDFETERGTAGDLNIIVTQPRRISATSISQRIADERLENIGDNVGYTIRLDSVPGKHINFCTSGVLLRIFQAKPNLDGIRYIIIDEIHERDINSDFLLILMRELLPKRPDLRLILMSATLQSELFSGFFGKAPVINVEGYVYPVQELYLEDLAKHAYEKKDGLTISSFKDYSEKMMLNAPEGESNISFKARGGSGHGANPRPRYGFMEAHTEVDYAAVEYAIKHIIAFNDMSHSSILVFLPGWDEIVRCRDVLEKNTKYHILAMHSSVNNEDQLQCFKPAPDAKIKIILSTNIAESGVTIDDIKGVVDVGRAKEKSFVLRKGRTAIGKNDMGTLSQLVTVFASRANCIQRRGRAGRTRPGMCIRLYSKEHFDSVADFQTPEMLRQPLDSLCLQILALNLGDPSAFLNKALEPPSAEAIEASMRRLEALGATTSTRQLTHLGLALSKLPVVPRTGKVILLGCMFKCLDSTLTIASTIENEVFNASRDSRESTKINREHMTQNTQSDHMASLNGFNSWASKIAENGPLNELMDFVKEHSLFIPALRNVSRYKKQFMDILAVSGFVEERPPKYQIFVDETHHSQFATDVGLVKGVIAAGLFPNIALYRTKRVLRAKHDNVVNVSNQSVIFRTPHEDIRNPFFCFEEMMRTSEANVRIQARGLSSVSIWAILLLGATNAQLAYRDDLNLGLIDDWLVFRAGFNDLDLIKRFKAFLAKAIVKKLTDPKDFDNNATMEVVRDIIRDLINQPLKANNLVEEAWEENGVITPGRASLIDPTIILDKPIVDDAKAEEPASEDIPVPATPETGASPTAENADGPKTTEAEATPVDPAVPEGMIKEVPETFSPTPTPQPVEAEPPQPAATEAPAFVPRTVGKRKKS